MAKSPFDNRIAEMVHALPLLEPTAETTANETRRLARRPRRSREIGVREQMRALEEKVRRYEEELTRLRVENEQLRRSSQAFGELAERLNVALHTATRVNRRMAGDSAARLRVTAPES